MLVPVRLSDCSPGRSEREKSDAPILWVRGALDEPLPLEAGVEDCHAQSQLAQDLAARDELWRRSAELTGLAIHASTG